VSSKKTSNDPLNQEKNLFIDRTAALYVGENQIRIVTNEGDQRVGSS